MRKLVAIVVLVIGTVAFPAAALAASPDNPSCWGAATRFRPERNRRDGPARVQLRLAAAGDRQRRVSLHRHPPAR
jgi:hypothetical protein